MSSKETINGGRALNMVGKDALPENEVYVKAALEFEPEKIDSNHAEDCSTKAFNEALDFVSEIIAKKLKGAEKNG